LDNRLLELIVCPVCKGPLLFRKAASEFVCKADRLAFAVRDDVPIMLEEEARKLDPLEELE